MEALKCPSCGSPQLTKVDANEYMCLNCHTRSRMSQDQPFLVLLQGWPCPSCGFTNDSGSIYCKECGGKLVKYCENCGNGVDSDASFCPKCGKKSFSPDRFRMTTRDVVGLRGGVTEVTGRIEHGTLKVGDEVYLKNPDSARRYVVDGIYHRFHKVDTASVGERVGVLLRDANKDDFHRGDILAS
jgi:RNA polymerase subunit RPABC4/transcription elongation factor Spt4